MNRLLLLPLTIIISLFVVPSAPAATTFGDDFSGSFGAFGSDYVLVPVRDPGGSTYQGSPAAGVITSVTTQVGGSAGTVSAIFVRPVSSLGTTINFSKIAENVDIAVTEDLSPTGHQVTVPTRVPVAAGDRVGLSIPSGIKAIYAYTGGDICAFLGGLDSQPVGSTVTYVVSSCNANTPAVRATVEPDADNDGYGDESQDLCPTDATRQTACAVFVPTPPNIVLKAVKSTSKTASSASRSFILSNTGQTAAALVPFAVKSSKSVKNLRIVKGCKPTSKKKPTSCSIASIAPGATVTIKVSMSIKAATKTTLTATSGALKATSTVKLKAKKK